MFKNLINFWKGKDFLSEVLKDFEEMLKDGETIFAISCKSLINNPISETDKIYEIDKKINEAERNIRRKVLEHLSFQPTVDVPVSLILMSVVKDAERLGDYSKNLFEVSKLLQKNLSQEQFRELFDEMDKKLIIIFQKTRECFLESNEEVANEIMNLERKIVKGCDEELEKIAASNLETNLAVCSALVLRYFKRIGSHLGNIATSVIMPVTDLDYFDKKKEN